MSLVSWVDRRFYPPKPLPFCVRLREILRPGVTALDLGAGRGALAEMDFRDTGARIYGADVDPIVETNPLVAEGRRIVQGRIPWPDETFDVVYSSYVLEHVERPAELMAEASRILKPGGTFIARTPNRWHYVPIIGSLTPHWFHVLAGKLRGQHSSDTFPTYYRMNTRRVIERHATESGFSDITISMHEGQPMYLRFLGATYLVGLAFERLVNSTQLLERLRVEIICELKKSDQHSQPADPRQSRRSQRSPAGECTPRPSPQHG
jgi:SAM-dependent methyltransferase